MYQNYIRYKIHTHLLVLKSLINYVAISSAVFICIVDVFVNDLIFPALSNVYIRCKYQSTIAVKFRYNHIPELYVDLITYRCHNTTTLKRWFSWSVGKIDIHLIVVYIPINRKCGNAVMIQSETETQMSSFWRNFNCYTEREFTET